MSSEGYYQLLCAKGHEWSADVYTVGDVEMLVCWTCGAKAAWWNGVNHTNGSYKVNPETGEKERIDGYVELEVDQHEIVCVCKDCGNRHVSEHTTYKIPENVGHRIEEVGDGAASDG